MMTTRKKRDREALQELARLRKKIVAEKKRARRVVKLAPNELAAAVLPKVFR